MSLTGLGSLVIPISTGETCGISIGNKLIYENTKNNMTKNQQTNKSSDKLCKKPVQDNVIDKYQHESVCNNFTSYVDETKNNLFFS